MAYSLLTHAAAGSSSSGATTGAIDTTGADLIVIGASYGASTTITVSDSKGNTWTPLTAQANASHKNQLYYCQAPTVGSGHTFTISGTNSYGGITVLAISGSTASPFDQQNGAAAAATGSIATGSITPSSDNELIVTAASFEFVGTPTVDSSFTQLEVAAYTPGATYGCVLGYQIQTTATARNPTWTFGGAGFCAAVIGSFKAAAVAATGFGFDPITAAQNRAANQLIAY